MNFKEISGDSYIYKAVGSSWVGFSWETKITVSNGKIIQRHFKYVNTEGLSDIPEEELEWIENDQEVGSHKNQGAEALTLDEIYIKAEKEWLIKRKNTKIYFETENNGLISTCGYVQDGCMDDYFIGIKIKSIESL